MNKKCFYTRDIDSFEGVAVDRREDLEVAPKRLRNNVVKYCFSYLGPENMIVSPVASFSKAASIIPST